MWEFYNLKNATLQACCRMRIVSYSQMPHPYVQRISTQKISYLQLRTAPSQNPPDFVACKSSRPQTITRRIVTPDSHRLPQNPLLPLKTRRPLRCHPRRRTRLANASARRRYAPHPVNAPRRRLVRPSVAVVSPAKVSPFVAIICAPAPFAMPVPFGCWRGGGHWFVPTNCRHITPPTQGPPLSGIASLASRLWAPRRDSRGIGKERAAITIRSGELLADAGF